MPMETKQSMGWGWWRGLNPFPESPEEDSRSVCEETEGGLARQAAATSTQKIPQACA